MKPKVKVSVIIPVYNGEQYLRNCIDSVLGQTLKNIEVLIVDDGSTDTTRNILRYYEAIDERVKPIYQANQGPATARNNALKQARGEFVAFIDADDWVDRETYATMYEVARENNADIVFTDMRWEYEDTTKRYTKSYSAKANKPLGRDEIKAEILTDFLYNGSYGSVCKLFRKNLIDTHDLAFPDGKYLGEDWLFNMDAFTYCQTAYYIDKPLYHYRQANDASLMRKYNPQLFDSYINGNTLETYAKRWGLYDDKVAVDLARRKCYIAVNGCIQNEFKPGCAKTIREKLALIERIVEHPNVVKAVEIALQHEESLARRLYLAMLKRKAVFGLFLAGKILSMRS
ncbi:Glycosyltransferase involved in biofilm formation, EpsH like [Bacillus mojavensis]|uniref:Glycosyltransferase involved in biofilm formation, EpsH like n=1 Tax=Bacillus mojavensis TaxID=72360 RepID=A0ABX6LZ86_BACMO|nr:glycosyltransferase family 2 protein [Bacillus mojavensis]QJC97139.1 Glycosyltransferase involved in biofilm formation, EpsH like [Bacillus mojavensis]